MLVPVGDWLAQLQDRKVSGLPSIEYGLNYVGCQESCPQDAARVTTPDASPLGDLRTVLALPLSSSLRQWPRTTAPISSLFSAPPWPLASCFPTMTWVPLRLLRV